MSKNFQGWDKEAVKPKTSVAKELSASEITQSALEQLSYKFIVWRQNNLTVRHRKGIVHKGVPDIIGYEKFTGIFICCEVKKIGDTLKPDQIKFLESVLQYGGFAYIATQSGNQVKIVNYKDYVK